MDQLTIARPRTSSTTPVRRRRLLCPPPSSPSAPRSSSARFCSHYSTHVSLTPSAGVDWTNTSPCSRAGRKRFKFRPRQDRRRRRFAPRPLCHVLTDLLTTLVRVTRPPQIIDCAYKRQSWLVPSLPPPHHSPSLQFQLSTSTSTFKSSNIYQLNLDQPQPTRRPGQRFLQRSPASVRSSPSLPLPCPPADPSTVPVVCRIPGIGYLALSSSHQPVKPRYVVTHTSSSSPADPPLALSPLSSSTLARRSTLSNPYPLKTFNPSTSVCPSSLLNTSIPRVSGQIKFVPTDTPHSFTARHGSHPHRPPSSDEDGFYSLRRQGDRAVPRQEGACQEAQARKQVWCVSRLLPSSSPSPVADFVGTTDASKSSVPSSSCAPSLEGNSGASWLRTLRLLASALLAPGDPGRHHCYLGFSQTLAQLVNPRPASLSTR